MKKKKCFIALLTAAVMMTASFTAFPEEAAAGKESSAESFPAEMASEITVAYYGQYSDTLQIFIGFDATNGKAIAAMYEPDATELEWACMGDYTIDENDLCKIESAEAGTSFEFTLVSEGDDTLEIQLQDGYLTLETADTDVIESFFAWLSSISGNSSGSGDVSGSLGSSSEGDSGEIAASDEAQYNELIESFDLAYYGQYNDDQYLLLGFNTEAAYGLAAITNPTENTLDWVCFGEWTGDGTNFQFEDKELGNVFEFTVEGEGEDTIEIGL
ncbi:MAG: hypothetical protein PHE06_02525, partial [Lachnospiraceae bacterium]|nr:hypothetical protein [Lachnospiraceae bacterium]